MYSLLPQRILLIGWQRLKQWMNNHTRNTSSGEGKQKKLDLSGKKAKRWQPYQAYSRLYYRTKLRSIITDNYIEYLAGISVGEEPDSLFKYRNNQLRVMLEAETDEVKEEVAEMCEKSVSAREEAEVEKMLSENFTEEDVKCALRKK
jgi:hypothetical protein